MLKKARPIASDRTHALAVHSVDVELDVEVDVQGEVAWKATVRPEQFWDALKEVCAKVGGEWAGMPERVWAFGPQRAGGCVLVDTRPDSKRSCVCFPSLRIYSES